MTQRPRFKPLITKIKLNPEQAVLACSCWNTNLYLRSTGTNRTVATCIQNSRSTSAYARSTGASRSVS